MEASQPTSDGDGTWQCTVGNEQQEDDPDAAQYI